VSDPIELAMEEALRPGRYISEHASFSVVNELESVAARIAGTDPERAVGLYETFIAACYEKADEVDDSSGYFGTFGGSLFSRWMTARQAASADPAAGCQSRACGLWPAASRSGRRTYRPRGRPTGPCAVHNRYSAGTRPARVRHCRASRLGRRRASEGGPPWVNSTDGHILYCLGSAPYRHALPRPVTFCVIGLDLSAGSARSVLARMRRYRPVAAVPIWHPFAQGSGVSSQARA
jgi:hypothetical protein